MEKRYMYDTYVMFEEGGGNVDLYGNPVERTKQECPYTYDAFVTYRNGENSEITNTVYSDRLRMWDSKKLERLMVKHFNGKGDYWNNRSPEKIEAFFRDWTDDQTLKLVVVLEGCNVSNGYPYWVFCYHREAEING